MTILPAAPTRASAKPVKPKRVGAPEGADPGVVSWVASVAELTEPRDIVWCDGSQEELQRLIDTMLEAGTIVPVPKRPGSYLARSNPDDVARMEDRTFICADDAEDAGPTNNWRDPASMRQVLGGLFDGAMRGRTMYVIPFSMGPVGGPISKLGIEITDSPYVVASMHYMTRVGTAALEAMHGTSDWVPAVHSIGAPLADGQQDVPWPCNPTRYISHFPETREIWSFGSAYGGNALLAKKCFALRIASVQARDEGWLAEHMLLLRMKHDDGRQIHLAGAFPSACGKTNLAMLQPTIPGWTVETLGDDIVWMRPGPDGRLWAINPENGFFGVAPGTSEATNATAMAMMDHDTIFTNVAMTPDGDVWWEGMTKEVPEGLIDWQGRPYDPANGPAAHPNARFTVRAEQAPSIAPDWDAPEGVPLDAIIFGGRRPTQVPLVLQARDWEHGVYVGATVSSQQTAAAEGPVGEIRRDPFAMLPFCGYNMGDYFTHWIDMGHRLGRHAPKIFSVNWFRRDEDGGFLWPGFGENARVLEWIAGRVAGTAPGVDTAVGVLPAEGALNLDGLDIDEAVMDELFEIDPKAWLSELVDVEAFFGQFGRALPTGLVRQLNHVRWRLEHVQQAQHAQQPVAV
ncbi:phosphoenolpyruvate carboxykinase (GTP) [Agrococcus sp. SCSIO52902]|uniref:phosphoenolpyruvate carboxykinase (GTP) n=1 Tax=Agrococcus sp. SCSIO52902 TaxID=2933290 RepID=UPI001FF524E8|nr:phosphoenolpyruvate carboxykinase (GTP) [Agrococcus sp. SCSIO52902]UOW00007.1 phosphoenolpyruvate carboxykinase (GTP) [Agrococcus sp. SCSIO52902]